MLGLSGGILLGSQGGGGGGGGDTDPNWDDVTLLVAADTLLVDRSKWGQVANPFGGAGIPSESGGYIVLNGTNQFIGWTNDPSLYLGDGDFTIEIFALNLSSNSACTVMGQTRVGIGANQAWNIYRRLSPERWIIIRNLSGSAGGSTTDLTVNDALSTATDYDICFERSGDVWRLYRGGSMLGKDTNAGTIFDSTQPLRHGARNNGGSVDDFLPGKFKVVRITRGTARYASDDGYTVPDLPLPADDIGLAGERVVPGVWSWFSDPRAITYASKLAVQAVQRDGADGHLHAFEGASPYGLGDFTRTILKTSIDNDDHNLGSFVRRVSDDKVLVAYAGHNSSELWTRLATAADSIASFDAEIARDGALGLASYTYASLVQLDGETDDPIYLFFRASDGTSRHFYRSISTDGGVTFGTGEKVLENNGDTVGGGSPIPPYVKMIQNGADRIDFACTDGHPANTATNSVYHFYWHNGAFRDTDGNALTLPIDPATDLTPVYDGTTDRAWLWNIQIDGSGNPVIAYTAYPSTTDHRYRRARYNGTSWDDEEIVAGGGYLYSGQPYYSGGIWLDPVDVDVAYLSREVGSPAVHQMFRYTRGGGGTWSGTQLTTNVRSSFRPFIPAGLRRLLYVNGRYTTFEDFYTHVCVADIS